MLPIPSPSTSLSHISSLLTSFLLRFPFPPSFLTLLPFLSSNLLPVSPPSVLFPLSRLPLPHVSSLPPFSPSASRFPFPSPSASLSHTFLLSLQGEASGKLYVDDGRSYAYLKSGQYLDVDFRFANSALRATPSGSFTYQTTERIERVIITGLSKKPTRASLYDPTSELSLLVPLEISSYGKSSVQIRKPDASISSSWEIQLHYD